MAASYTPSYQDEILERTRIVIVGAGISGICLAIQLKRRGIHDFILLEQSDDVGGTWMDNTYPGCGCDVPSMLYSFSFAQNGQWSRKYAPQEEILQYFRDCANRFSILSHIRFGASVDSAKWQAQDDRWLIEMADGSQLRCDFFVSAVGQLSRPQFPSIDGIERFTGKLFHSARWDHTFRPAEKRLGVIGNGASAIQIIPELAKTASHVTIFQRSPNWILHRHDHRYPWWWRTMNRFCPLFARFQRLLMYLFFEARIFCYNRRTFLNNGFTAWSRYKMRKAAPRELHSEVIPTFPAGCKRVLLSNNYLQSLHRDNVSLESSEIDCITSDGIQTKSRHVELDAIIMATGFETNRFLYPIEVYGRDGTQLSDQWARRPKTFLGILAPKFPNFFMLYGPNTNLGHNSIIFMVERQVNYILKLLGALKQNNADVVEVTEKATDHFDQNLQRHLQKKVWNGYAASWYKNAMGDITNNWCRSTLAYMWLTRRVDQSMLQFSTRPCATAAETAPIAR